MASQEIIDKVHAILDLDHFGVDEEKQLIALGPSATALLAQYATGNPPPGLQHYQSRAIVALASCDEPQHQRALVRSLHKLSIDDRIRAVVTLGRGGNDESLDALDKHLNDSATSLVEMVHAARALARSPKDKAMQILQRARGKQWPSDVLNEIDKAIDKANKGRGAKP